VETKITPYRSGGGGEVFRVTLKLGRLNQRKLGQVPGVLEIFDLQPQSIHSFSIVRHRSIGMSHHLPDTPGLHPFDGSERLEGDAGLAHHLIRQVSIPKQTSDQHDFVSRYFLLQLIQSCLSYLGVTVGGYSESSPRHLLEASATMPEREGIGPCVSKGIFTIPCKDATAVFLFQV